MATEKKDNGVSSAFDTMIGLIKKPFDWVDRLFANFEWYTTVGFARYFIYAMMLYAISFVFKSTAKFDVRLGK